MKRIKTQNLDGRTREERETCFPKAFPNNEERGQVRDDG